MAENRLDRIFEDESYRALKGEEKRVYGFLSTVVEKKKMLLELEKSYRARLKEIADEVAGREGALNLSAQEADAAADGLKKTLKAADEKIKSIRRELDFAELRLSAGEFGREELDRERDRLQRELSKAEAERSWIQDKIALVKKLKSGSRRTKPREEQKERKTDGANASSPRRPAEAEKDNTQTTTSPIMSLKGFGGARSPDATIISEMTLPIKPTGGNFDAEETMAIPADLVGSDPDRLLEASLHIHNEDGWERFPLKKEDVSIGNIREPENDIALYDAQVSRRHAKIIYDEPTDCWFLVDLGSRNGSFLNNKFIESNDPQLLKDKDRITLGETSIVIHLP
ncbi:MAG: FHA domain-containing protein [Candidatus Nitrospinota bacterium M3_3B_026]